MAVEEFCTMSVGPGVRVLAVSVCLLALGGASAAAANAVARDLTTTVTTTTTQSTAGALPTTTEAAATTTGAASTISLATPTTTTTAAPTTTTTAAATSAPHTTTPARSVPVAPAAVGGATCLRLGSLAVLRPGRSALVVGAAGLRRSPTAVGSLRYPASGGAVFTARGRSAAASCETTPSGSVSLRALSLFAGAIEADSVTIQIEDGRLATDNAIGGLRIDGQPVQMRPGVAVRVGSWGLLGSLNGLVCPGASSRVRDSGLAIHMLTARGGLPAGTTLLVAFADLPVPVALDPLLPPPVLCPGTQARVLGGSAQLHLPLAITPALGGKTRYVFPVAAPIGVFDSYGALRSDTPDGWHHGDDLFAPIGTPVVAVADGTINRAGWNPAGGWRLWVRDNVGDQFYYAHLSGYTPLALRDGRVKAGQVIGFVGDSGGALHTPAHLHFEIHPRSLLFLGYDGAVDPTSYIQAWPHLTATRAAKPVLPKLPPGPARAQAAALYRKLLLLRGYRRKPTEARSRRTVDTRARERTTGSFQDATPSAPHAPKSASSSPSGWLLGSPLGAAALILASVVALRRRRRGLPPSPVADAKTEDVGVSTPALAARPGSTTHALVRIATVLLVSSAAVRAGRRRRAPQDSRKIA
jgi:Peptidase family M23